MLRTAFVPIVTNDMTDMANNPYQDQSNGVDPNNWMINYRNISPTLPA